MKKFTLALLALSASFTLSQTALANDPGNCGLPSLAIKSSTINILVNFFTSMPTYTLGVTSGTSGCKGMVAIDQERSEFIASNYDSLTEEAAQGKGLHLETLAGLMGCQSSKAQFAQMTQKNFGSLFVDQADAVQVLERLKAGIKAQPALSCTPDLG